MQVPLPLEYFHSFQTWRFKRPVACKALPTKGQVQLYFFTFIFNIWATHVFDFTTYIHVSIISQFYSLSLEGPSSILFSKPPPPVKVHSKWHTFSSLSFSCWKWSANTLQWLARTFTTFTLHSQLAAPTSLPEAFRLIHPNITPEGFVAVVFGHVQA